MTKSDSPAKLKSRQPSPRQQRLLMAFDNGDPKHLKDLGNIAFKRERPEAKRYSWARNNIRWLLANKFVKKVGEGMYQRVDR